MNDSQKTAFMILIAAAVFIFSVIVYINLYSEADTVPLPRLPLVSPTPFVYKGTVAGIEPVVRTAPGSKAEVAFVITPGSPVELLRRRQDWVLIRTATGNTGWMLHSDVRTLGAEPPEAAAAEAEENDPQSLPKRGSVNSNQ